MVTLFMVGMTALLVVPRPIEPGELPPPVIDPRALLGDMALDDARAAAAQREPLDADVRALGSALHAYGRADFAGKEDALLEARSRAVDAAGPARALGDEAVLRLRAFEQREFLRELLRWEATGQISESFRELGGGFLRLLEDNGWVEIHGGRRRVMMDEATLRAFFKKRWNEVTAIRAPAFELTLNEQRASIRFLLEHPTALTGGLGQPNTPAWCVARQIHDDQFRLKKIDELAALDPSYPSDLARGIVLYRLKRYPLAVEAFRRHIESAPDAPYALRAQNYLRAALGRARDEVF